MLALVLELSQCFSQTLGADWRAEKGKATLSPLNAISWHRIVLDVSPLLLAFSSTLPALNACTKQCTAKRCDQSEDGRLCQLSWRIHGAGEPLYQGRRRRSGCGMLRAQVSPQVALNSHTS